MKHTITVYTDGSSRGNPGKGGWGAIISDKHRVKELGGREAHTTNNRMELRAACEALSCIAKGDKGGFLKENSGAVVVELYTDSSYMINGITKWVPGWIRNDWKTSQKEDVVNRDLWETLWDLRHRVEVSWHYVRGHAGTPANERCDVIATSFADSEPTDLFDGTRKEYSIDLTFSLDDHSRSGTHASSLKKVSAKKRSAAAAYSYVSMVGGEVKIHVTWKECEARVKGKSGARFKKALDAQEERAIIDEFSKR